MQKQFFTVLAFVASMFAMQTTNAQVLYSEDFEGTGGVMPTNLTIIDGDAAAANANVLAFDNWIISQAVRPTAGVDSVAAVTSWLDPAGASDDWLITPLVTGLAANATLSWEAAARDFNFADGYEVWVTSTIAGTTPVISDFTTNGTRVFFIASEDTLLTPHSVSLAAFANQSVYVGFRNNSNDQFILEVDDILVENAVATDDLSVNGVFQEYTIYPLSQAQIPLLANIGNVGNTNATDAVLTANVLLGGIVQQTFSSPATALNSGANTNLNLGSYTASASGTYTIEFIVSSATLTDNNTSNDTARLQILVDDNFFARDNASPAGGLGGGPGTAVTLGQTYDVVANAQIDSVLFFIAPGAPGLGDTLQVIVTDVVAGVPTNTIGQSALYIITAADTVGTGAVIQLPVTNTTGGALTITPGQVFVGLSETAAGDNMSLQSSAAIYIPGTTFGRIGTGAYQDITALLPTFTRPFIIRPYLSISCPTIATTTSINDATCTAANGDATVIATGGATPYTYMWDATAAGQMAPTATGLAAGTYAVTVTDANGCTGTASATVGTQNTTITTTDASTDAGCGLSDGTATTTPAGGTAPYTYMWDGSAAAQMTASVTGLAAGVYNVTITDANGCNGTAAITVDNPNAPTAVASVNSNYNGADVTCNGATDGTAMAGASGGTMPYTYAWSNGQSTAAASGLPAGVYTVTATDAANCAGTASIIVTEPSAVVATIPTVVNALCNGDNGTATAVATGGTGTYTYLWMGAGQATATASNPAGTHTVMVTDQNGCTAMDSVTITEPTALTVGTTGVTNVACNGGDGAATALVAGGTAPYTYLWSGGETTDMITPPAGSHTVTATDANGCTNNASVTITEPVALVATATDNGNGTATAAATGGTATYTYLWSDGQAVATATFTANGTYMVTVTDANGCTSMASVNVTVVGLNDITTLSTLNIFPNPTSANVMVDLEMTTTNEVTLRVVNATGQTVINQYLGAIQSDRIEVHTADLTTGVYFMHFTIGNEHISRKLIVSKR